MKNKTCGECKHYNAAMFHCEKFDCMAEDGWSCPDCEEKEKPKPTNGDKIRQMSNEELASKFGYPCPPLPKKHCKGIDNIECTECWLNWLNAPAESEGGR